MLKLEFQRRQGALSIDVKLALEARVTALFGPSGAGKSSILHCVAGLAQPDSGEIALDGRVLWSSAAGINLPPEQRRLGYVFQDVRLFPHLSVRANLQYGVRARHLAYDRERESAIVELLGLGALMDRAPRTLSGGEQQRVAIGRAVLTDPQLLLLDEPLASLDVARRMDVLGYMQRLRNALDIAMVYVSHDTEEVLMLADQVVCIQQGKVVAQGLPATTLAVAERSWAMQVRREGLVLRAVVAEPRNATGLTILTHPAGRLKLPGLRLDRGRNVELRVQPTDVILSRDRCESMSVRNVLPAKVIEISEIGDAQACVTLAVGPDRLESLVTREAVDDLRLHIGAEVFALVKASVVEAAPHP
jgi:molybdate transport system ATP-binding protein